MKPYDVVVLYSGGIDSFICYEYVLNNILKDNQSLGAVYFYLRSKYSNIELESIEESGRDVVVDHSLKLGDIEQEDATIPLRNILLATMAASRYSNIIYIGGSMSDRVPDNNKEVFTKLSDTLRYASDDNSIFIDSPFWNMYKEDMVEWYCRKFDNAAINLLYSTFSCYNPTSIRQSVQVNTLFKNSSISYDSHHCFKCPACFRRNACLLEAGLFLPFWNHDIVNKYKTEFLNEKYESVGEFHKNRRYVTTLKYIKGLEEVS